MLACPEDKGKSKNALDVLMAKSCSTTNHVTAATNGKPDMY